MWGAYMFCNRSSASLYDPVLDACWSCHSMYPSARSPKALGSTLGLAAWAMENGMTGTELVWEWLHKYDLAKYIKDVTAEKPRCICYIDDKAINCYQNLEQETGFYNLAFKERSFNTIIIDDKIIVKK